MDKQLEKFFRYWFSGFESGLKNIDSGSGNKVLQCCGEACADSYTRDIFRQAKVKSSNLGEFLKNLSKKFPAARYRLISGDTISAVYNKCGCDIVSKGFIKSPLFCNCSAANLKANFQTALGKKIEVELKNSILGGADRCSFLVKILPP